MTTITTLPEPPSRDEPTTFTARADAFLGALPTFGTECNAVASEVNAAAAQATAAASLISQDGYTGSSTSTNTINSSGAPSFTTQTGRLWIAGQLVQFTATGSPTNYMVGTVSSYSGNTLTVNLQNSNGSGTFSDWKIGLVSNYIQPVDMLVNGVAVGRGKSASAGLTYSTVLGYQALSNSFADYHVGVGYQALSTPSTNVGGSVAVGYQAAMAPSGSAQVTAVGYQALKSIGSGISNTAVGNLALTSATSISYNTAIGNGALASLATTGASNTAVGAFACNSLTVGSNNVAMGHNALALANTINDSVAVGVSSGYTAATVSESVAVGKGTGLQTASVSVGFEALKQAPTTYNVAVGYKALTAMSVGSGSAYITALGPYAAYANNTAYTNCTALGYLSTFTASNQVSLGDAGNTAATYTNNGSVYSRSDIRDKADIRDTVLGLDFIKAIRPVDYKWDHRGSYMPERPADLPEYANDDEKAAHALALEAWQTACKWENLRHDGSKKRNRYHHGVIAQEVQELINTTGVDFGGFQDHKISGGDDVLSIGYSEFIAPLIKAVQELAAQNAELSARIAVLEAK